MKISTKGRYGLEAVVDLAMHEAQGPVSVRSIAERCGHSETYLLQLFLKLRRAGVIESVRGAGGGYKLVRPPSELTVRCVLEALEGPLTPVDCVFKQGQMACDRYENCTTRPLWEDMTRMMREITQSITLQDLLDCERQLMLDAQERHSQPEPFLGQTEDPSDQATETSEGDKFFEYFL